MAPGLELGCAIVDASGSGYRLRLDRSIALPRSVVLVELASGLASDAEPAWSKGLEVGLRRVSPTSLRGLVPVRFAAARTAWLKAGGR